MDLMIPLAFAVVFAVLHILTKCASNIYYNLTWKTGGYYRGDDFDMEEAIRERNRINARSNDRTAVSWSGGPGPADRRAAVARGKGGLKRQPALPVRREESR